MAAMGPTRLLSRSLGTTPRLLALATHHPQWPTPSPCPPHSLSCSLSRPFTGFRAPSPRSLFQHPSPHRPGFPGDSSDGVPSLLPALDVRARSFQVSGPGAIDSPLISSMKQKISEALSTEDVVVQDVQGDGRHVSIRVIAEVFEGKRSVDRQRMVYRAIWEELQGVVHAVDNLVTLAPSEASSQ